MMLCEKSKVILLMAHVDVFLFLFFFLWKWSGGGGLGGWLVRWGGRGVKRERERE